MRKSLEGGYDIHAHPYKFKANVSSNISEGIIEYQRVTFGYQKMCVAITVYPHDPVGHLEGVSYNELCGINEFTNTNGLESGSDTVKMLKTALRFTCDLWSQVKSFSLKDSSSIDCNHGRKVSLNYLHLAKHGKTWYQDKFGAVPQTKDDEKYLVMLNETMEAPITEPFEWFYDKYILRFQNRMLMKKPQLVPILKPIYEQATTIREFIQLASKNDCIIFEHWFDVMMSKLCLFQFAYEYWVIPETSIESWSYRMTVQRTNKPHEFESMRGGADEDEGFFPYGKGASRVPVD
jgi:hypothetical protein